MTSLPLDEVTASLMILPPFTYPLTAQLALCVCVCVCLCVCACVCVCVCVFVCVCGDIFSSLLQHHRFPDNVTAYLTMLPSSQPALSVCLSVSCCMYVCLSVDVFVGEISIFRKWKDPIFVFHNHYFSEFLILLY